MKTSQVSVSTKHASRYLQQLCKHWSHKFETEFTATRATIALPLGETHLTADDDHLTIEVFARETEELPQLQHVVQSHIERFAFKEALEFEWR